MAESKGKFIIMACTLLAHRPQSQAEAGQRVKKFTGQEWNQLDPEGWYDTQVFDAVLRAAEAHEGAIIGQAVCREMGRDVYPTIGKTVGFPPHLKTPLDWLQFEGEGFLKNHRGPGVVPRKFTQVEPGHIIVEALMPGYGCVFIEGVFEGILQMCGVNDYKVRQSHCTKMGDQVCQYDITWKE